MDSLFSSVFGNQILNQIIFEHVPIINKKVNIPGAEQRYHSYSWKQLNEVPTLLSKLGYVDQLRSLFARKEIDRFVVQACMKLAIEKGHFNTLKYLFEEANVPDAFSPEVFYHAIKFSQLEIVKYFESKSGLDWDNEEAMLLAPLTNSLEFLIERSKKFESEHKVKLRQPHTLSRLFDNAAAVGSIEMIEWAALNRPSYRTNNYMYHCAARENHIHVLKYLKRLSNPLDVPEASSLMNLYSAAAGNGSLDALKWLKENNIGNSNQNAMNVAAANGHFDAVLWLHENRTEGCNFEAVEMSLRNKHYNIFKWLYCNYPNERHSESVSMMAKKGNLAMLKWLHEQNDQDFNGSLLNDSLKNGNLKVAKWLFENRTEQWETVQIYHVETKGGVEILEWLHEKRIPFNVSQDSLHNASRFGQLEVLKWLQENRGTDLGQNSIPGFNFGQDPNTAMDLAAESGFVDILKWLKENRSAQCSVNAMNKAAGNGKIEALQWLHENTTAGCTGVAYVEAARGGHLNAIQWLHTHRTEKGAPSTIDLAAQRGYLDIIKYLHENRNDGCSKAAMDNAAGSQRLDILKWLHANRTEGFSEAALYKAISSCNLEIITWLFDNNKENLITDLSCLSRFPTPKNLQVISFLRNRGYDVLAALIKQRSYELFMVVFEDSDISHVPNLINVALENNPTDSFIEWLNSKGVEITEEALDIAAKKKNKAQFELLLNKMTQLDPAVKRRRLEQLESIQTTQSGFGSSTFSFGNGGGGFSASSGGGFSASSGGGFSASSGGGFSASSGGSINYQSFFNNPN
ncbi:hypothetical protein PPL_05658 [Heterostelium album PN500]|uniref:Ankyrin repeat protein n=1 Tax=Heterostelium pallidum (strain ATCC 26659 / Pp 5 / PN500) TaxID=670386 RepID=D3BAS7_HETP5|nr:hypothetical protein PPL_05658 [Heterostelium album PN500]EFA81664.1 hypothetical protein PPL_05658 [Heterostelium album PN500]|eukprot:XP_020433781.1 hypothetical protein PPL_05658 [Heterostelium album PN500]